MSDVLHYPGDRRNFDPDLLVGPDLFGAFYSPVSAVYDGHSDMTTISFRPVPPAELRTLIEEIV